MDVHSSPCSNEFSYVKDSLKLNLCTPVSTEEQNEATAPGPKTISTTSNFTNRAKSRKTRVYVFYDFLIKTYPFLSTTPSRSKSKIIVLDVAGGRGNLSWLFSNLHHHIQSIVIDPRNDLVAREKNYKSILKSISFLEVNPDIVQERNAIGSQNYHPLAALLPQLIQRRNERSNDKKIMKDHDHDHHCYDKTNSDYQEDSTKMMETCEKNHETEEGKWVYPQRMKIYFDNVLVRTMTKLNSSKQSSAKLQNLLQLEESSVVEQKENSHVNLKNTWSNYWYKAIGKCNSQESSTNTYDEQQVVISGIIPCPDKALEYFTNTKLIVGFHPDQATEAIVDLALELHIPFCIVPCCVFPKDFPNRFINRRKMDGAKSDKSDIGVNPGRNNDGQRVRDYQTFLTYLKCKDERIREAELDFQFSDTARKVVLYMLPQDFQ